ncbi:MAG: hypothetical protein JKX94_05755 [Sneathiella sp.]|nr:hypothetical protein [Sneathiella sp.]
MSEFQILQLVALIMVAGLVLPGFLYYTKKAKKGAILRNIAIWLVFAIVAAIAYRVMDPVS